MPCLLGCLALSVPRLVLAMLWLFTDYVTRAIQPNIWIFLGFLFMPCTTLAYAWAKNANGSVEGIYFAVVIFGVLVDLGIVTFGRNRRRRGGGGGGASGGGEPPPNRPREITVTGQRVG
ncbi:MAG: hypothetical protein SGI72_09920 [Planctomycetota bacterium]|nr:hypothetical protein [Planctomycetota bacterium]